MSSSVKSSLRYWGYCTKNEKSQNNCEPDNKLHCCYTRSPLTDEWLSGSGQDCCDEMMRWWWKWVWFVCSLQESNSPSSLLSLSLQSTPVLSLWSGLVTGVNTQINNFNQIIFSPLTKFSLFQAGDPTDVMYGWCHKCREKFKDQYKALTG